MIMIVQQKVHMSIRYEYALSAMVETSGFPYKSKVNFFAKIIVALTFYLKPSVRDIDVFWMKYELNVYSNQYPSD